MCYITNIGIRQKPISLCTSPMKIHKITPSVHQNWWFKRLDTQLTEPTIQNSVKVQTVVELKN